MERPTPHEANISLEALPESHEQAIQGPQTEQGWIWKNPEYLIDATGTATSVEELHIRLAHSIYRYTAEKLPQLYPKQFPKYPKQKHPESGGLLRKLFKTPLYKRLLRLYSRRTSLSDQGSRRFVKTARRAWEEVHALLGYERRL
jgi:hypothetical protein